MPMIFVEGATGLSDHAKEKMVKELTSAADEAYHVPDVRLWLRSTPRSTTRKMESSARRFDRSPSWRHRSLEVSRPSGRWSSA